ncbi:D-alanyl-D-alanine carboxypeptidase, partial [Clostridioides difficile]|nr:D-alanyl-D-alanine carboxypeptidase [Clostridioides difficile]
NYESVKLCSKGDNIATLTLDKADENKVKLVAKEDLNALIKKGSSKEFEKKIEIVKNPKMPIKKGTVLGKIKICKDKKVIGEVELINTKDINKASYLQMLQRIIDNMI